MRAVEMIRDLWLDLDRHSRLWLGYALIMLLIGVVGWSALHSRVLVLEKKRTGRETVLKELLPLKVAYLTARQSSDLLTGRMASLRPDDSPAKLVEETGIKGKSVKITPIKGEEKNGYSEDGADIRIESLTMNEVVNLMYRLEKGNRPLIIKKSNIRIRFDDQSRCDLHLGLALLRPVAGQVKK